MTTACATRKRNGERMHKMVGLCLARIEALGVHDQFTEVCEINLPCSDCLLFCLLYIFSFLLLLRQSSLDVNPATV